MEGQIMLSINDINMLEKQNEGYRKQNKALQESFFKILAICNETADNMAVVELQDRIKAVLNG